MLFRSLLAPFAVAWLLGCGAQAAAPSQRPIRNASVISLPDSPWENVFVDAAEFTLRAGDPNSGEPPAVLVGTVDELRQVGAARVAKLRWHFSDNDAAARPYLAGPHYLVESARGIAFLLTESTDAEISALLVQPNFWMFPHPTREHPVDGPSGETASVTVNDGEATACYSIEMPACGAGVCSSDVCVTSAHGIVSLGGQWAPGGALFAAE